MTAHLPDGLTSRHAHRLAPVALGDGAGRSRDDGITWWPYREYPSMHARMMVTWSTTRYYNLQQLWFLYCGVYARGWWRRRWRRRRRSTLKRSWWGSRKLGVFARVVEISFEGLILWWQRKTFLNVKFSNLNCFFLIAHI